MPSLSIGSSGAPSRASLDSAAAVGVDGADLADTARAAAVSPRVASLAHAASTADHVLDDLLHAVEAHASAPAPIDASRLDARALDGMTPAMRGRFVEAVRLKCTHLTLPAGASTPFEWLPDINRERASRSAESPNAPSDAAHARGLLTVRIGSTEFVPRTLGAARDAGTASTAAQTGSARLTSARASHAERTEAAIDPPSLRRDLSADAHDHIVVMGLRSAATHRQRSDAVERLRVALPDATHRVLVNDRGTSAQPLGFDRARQSHFAFDHVLREERTPKGTRAAFERCIQECAGRVHLNGDVFNRLSTPKLAMLVDALKAGDVTALHIDCSRISNASFDIVLAALKQFALAGDELQPREFGLKLSSTHALNADVSGLMSVVQELPLTKLDMQRLVARNYGSPLVDLLDGDSRLTCSLRELDAGNVHYDELSEATFRFDALESLDLGVQNVMFQLAEQVCAKLMSMPTLKRLRLIGVPVEDHAAFALAQLHRLESLHIKSNLTESGLSHLADLPALRHLALEGRGALAPLQTDVWARFSQLRSLELLARRDDSDELRMFEHLTRLERVKLVCCIDSEIEFIEQLTALTELSLPAAGPSEDRLFPALARFQALKSFEFGYLDPSDGANGLKASNLDCLTSMTRLERLALSQVCLGPEDVAKVAAMPVLQTLHLDNDARVNSAGLASLARSPTLRALRLIECPSVDDAGVREIAKCRGIEALELTQCSAITDASVPVLANMPRLTALNVEQTGISARGQAELARSFASIEH